MIKVPVTVTAITVNGVSSQNRTVHRLLMKHPWVPSSGDMKRGIPTLARVTLRRWRTDPHSITTENLHSRIHPEPLLLLDTPGWMRERSKHYQVILTFILPTRKSLLLCEYLFRGTDFLRVCRKTASRNSTGLMDQGDKLQPDLIKDWRSFTLIKYSAL